MADAAADRGAYADRAPAISVVVPSYNQSVFLEQALRSVLDQDYPEVECIVMDGGSTDGSREIIEKYDDDLAYWESEPDDGQAHAINRGWRISSGSVLGWLNSDDVLEPGALTAVGRAFAHSPSPRVVYGDCRVLDRSGRERRIERPAGYDVRRLLLGKSLPQPSVFLHRSLVGEVGELDESLRYALDWDFFLRALLRCPQERVRYLARCLSGSRVYEGTKTRTGLAEKGDERREVLARLRERGLLDGFSGRTYRRAIGGTYWVQAADEWMAGRSLDAVASGLRAVVYDPARLGQALTSAPWLVGERWRRRRSGNGDAVAESAPGGTGGQP